MITEARKLLAAGALRTCSCPVTLAVKAALGVENRKEDYVTSNESFILINKLNYDTPKAAAVFINHFDMGKTVEPISFELDLTQGRY